MVSVNRKTAALKLPMVQVRECNFQTAVMLEERPVERLAFFVCDVDVTPDKQAGFYAAAFALGPAFTVAASKRRASRAFSLFLFSIFPPNKSVT